MRISVLQQEFHGFYYYNPNTEKPPVEQLKEAANASIDRCIEMIEKAATEGADLAITIEGVNDFIAYGDTRYSNERTYDSLDGPVVKRFSEAAKKNNIHIVAGLSLSFDEKVYNCAVLFDNKGEIIGVHKKVHLPAGEELTVTPGDKFEVFHTEIGNIGMLVCWDLQYPEAVRELALGGADLIAVPTLGWEKIYGLSRAYENSITIAAGMAFENGYTGYGDPACIVDTMGKILAEGPLDSEAVVTADVDITKEPLPQYGSENYIDSSSMRKTRFLQRMPHAYRLINEPLENTPLFKRYFKN